MAVKTVKGIKEKEWRTFKALAAEKNLTMGTLFEMMVEDYSKHADSLWEKILCGKRILSEKEAKELEKAVKSMRKEHGFRA